LRLIDPGDTGTLVEVHTGRHAALYSIGRLDEADEEYRTIKRLCRTALQRADATVVQVHSLTQRKKSAEAIELGLDSLRECGITVPAADRLPPSSTASSTICTGGWTTPTPPTIWLGLTSPTRRCWPRPG